MARNRGRTDQDDQDEDGGELDSDEGPGRVRLDKWLWAARFFKTRSLAADAIEGGKVSVNGDRAKRARLLQLGDELRIRQGAYEQVLHVKGLSNRRGSAPIAQQLYEETAASKEAREKLSVQMRAAHGDWDKGKPTKQDRRAIDRWKGR